MRGFKFGMFLALVMPVTCFLIACSPKASRKNDDYSYMSITAKEAKDIMDSEAGYLILDVRTPEEYEEGHIADAVLIPDYEISKSAKEKLTDKEQTILVYCRSGRRSKNAAEQLAILGYTNVMEFGGIIDWPYDIEK